MAKSRDPDRLRQGPRPLLLRRLLERRAPHHGGGGAYADQYDGFLAGARATTCRWRPSPTSPAPSATPPSPPTRPTSSTGFTAAERTLSSNAVLADATRSMAHRRPGAGRRRLPGGLQPRRRRADLHRRARRHLPVGGAEDGHRARSSAAPRPAPAASSIQLPVRQRAGRAAWRSGIHRAAGARLRRGRHHLEGAARSPSPASTARPSR